MQTIGCKLFSGYKYSVAEIGWMLMLADKQEDRSRRITVGADKADNAKDFVVDETPLEPRWRTTRHPG